MAECLDEFDAPSPSPKRYCCRITVEEYEKIGDVTTEIALRELLEYLEYNPTAFFDILEKKRKEEIDSGIFTMLKAKLSEYFGWSSSHEINKDGSRLKLRELKENIVKSYNYGQGLH